MLTVVPPIAELDAGPAWRRVDFIADLHLHPCESDTISAWERYLATTPADALFILGDWFESWVGDDAASVPGFEARCAELMRQASGRTALFIMCGNRDFLLGEVYARQCGAKLLADPSVLPFAGQRWLLSHGDALCLDDTAYMAFRAQVRTADWQRGFLARPLAERQTIVRGLRAQSEARKRSGSPYVSVDPATARNWLQAAQATTLIHGHTHRPGEHGLGPGLRRVELSDWDLRATPPRAQALRLSSDGQLRRVKLARDAAAPAPPTSPTTPPEVLPAALSIASPTIAQPTTSPTSPAISPAALTSAMSMTAALPDSQAGPLSAWLHRRRKRRELRAASRIPEALWRRTLARYPFLAQRTPEELARLRSLSGEFLSTKEFHGAQGFAVTDAMAVAIAAQACLPVLHLGLAWYDDFVGIVVHRDQVLARREVTDELGLVHSYAEALSGEAMERGPVTLSWRDVAQAGASASTGYNVVIHEFTHKIDLCDGQPDGCPPLPSRAARQSWLAVMEREYAAFREKTIIAERFGGQPSWLDPYGAAAIDEFFAVACEAYFVNRDRFAREFPLLVPLFDSFFTPNSE